jgi:hypothetical protein
LRSLERDQPEQGRREDCHQQKGWCRPRNKIECLIRAAVPTQDRQDPPELPVEAAIPAPLLAKVGAQCGWSGGERLGLRLVDRFAPPLEHEVGELQIVAKGAGSPPEPPRHVLGPGRVEVVPPVGREGSRTARDLREATLRGPLMTEQQSITLVDQPCQRVDVVVEDADVPGHGRNLGVQKGRENPADPVGLQDGVRIDHQDKLRPASLPHRAVCELVAEHRDGGRPRSIDGRLLRLSLAQVPAVAYHPPVRPLLISLVDGKQFVEVRRAVVDHQEVHLTLVVLPRQRAEAGLQDIRILVVGRDDDIDTGKLVPDVRKPFRSVLDCNRPVSAPEPFLQRGMEEKDGNESGMQERDGNGGAEERDRECQPHCRRHLGITRRPLPGRRASAPCWFPPCTPP